ncbi:metallophosphoesterase [Propioniciclava soli]|uniref:metallophosphoesterase n=1 Tax=Propioniciclava soli TaxID=2775081 RepID=UPI001E2C33EA|nr:metallophosphoesterase [Propioniciclava soli]
MTPPPLDPSATGATPSSPRGPAPATTASTDSTASAATPQPPLSRPRPRHVLAHLSDLHLTGDGSRIDGVVDARARLTAALDVLTTWGVRCDAWVFSGDLSDDGSPASYAFLAEQVGAAAATAGVRVIWGNGNHDERAAFRAGLGIGDGVGPSGLILGEHDLRGLRVLTVDSNVPGTPAGQLSDEALSWLSARLEHPAEAGTVLVVHHCPLPQPQDATELWPLRNPGALAEVVRGTDTRLILSGHFHQTGFGTVAGVPVAMASSLTYTQEVGLSPDLRGQDANTGFSLVELFEDSFVVTAVPLARGEGVHPSISSADARARLAGAGVQRGSDSVTTG